jgi:hypothetical protein
MVFDWVACPSPKSSRLGGNIERTYISKLLIGQMSDCLNSSAISYFLFLSSRLVPYTLFMCVIVRAFGSSCIRERTLLISINELEVKPMLSKKIIRSGSLGFVRYHPYLREYRASFIRSLHSLLFSAPRMSRASGSSYSIQHKSAVSQNDGYNWNTWSRRGTAITLYNRRSERPLTLIST